MIEDQTPASWYTEMQRRQAEALKVGARVRVRISECPYCFTDAEQISRNDHVGTIFYVGHLDWVLAANEPYPNDTLIHYFWVQFDGRIETASHFAAAELEPLLD